MQQFAHYTRDVGKSTIWRGYGKPAAFQNDLLEGSPQAEQDALDSRAASLSVFQPPKWFNHVIPSQGPRDARETRGTAGGAPERAP